MNNEKFIALKVFGLVKIFLSSLAVQRSTDNMIYRVYKCSWFTEYTNVQYL